VIVRRAWLCYLLTAAPVWVVRADAADQAADETVRSAQKLVLLVAVTTLLLAFLFVFVIVARLMMRARQNLLKRKPEPTPTNDIWSMHKLPDDLEAGGGDENKEGPNKDRDGDDGDDDNDAEDSADRE